VKAGGRAIGGLLLLVLAVSAAQQWWAGSSERRAGARLAALAQPGDIRMLSSESCVYCEAARRTMAAHGVRFDECFIERDRECQALYEATLARGTPTLIVRGQMQWGFRIERVIGALEGNG
jgi:glutaredoxin